MAIRDWIVTDDGQCQPRPTAREWDLIEHPYYFHRFLTEIMDLLARVQQESEEWDYLPQIRQLVRKLITNSYWIQTQVLPPDPKTGVAIQTLYDEIGYPLTIQNVTLNSGVRSPIHNHGTWGVVVQLQGQEKHTFWRQVEQNNSNDYKIEIVGEKILKPGELISFTPAAIHHIEALGDRSTVTFNLYGDTQPKARFKFDPLTHTAKLF
jgi:predicted metal-dependent enzyme (double-stranded beta helix superfamily)